jgi:hypothetical protein
MVLSSSKAENNKHNHTLLSWIAHIKQDHDNSNKPTSIAIDPVVQKDPLLLQQPINVATVVLDPPPKSRGSDDSSNTNSKRQSLFHFHRPHGLFRQNIKEKQVNQDTTPIETKLRKSPSISASTCSYCQSMCASLSDNDADDERTVNDDNDARSIDGTKKPFPCRFSPPEPQYNRDNSVHTLLGDIDSSQTGFKKLRKDGYLDDLDDVNCFLLEQEAGDEDDASAISKKRSVFSRAVIRNNLIRLALNG